MKQQTYNRAFIWLVQSQTTDATIGSILPTWTPQPGIIWGSLEGYKGMEALLYQSKESVVNYKVKLKGYTLQISFKDRLIDKETGVTLLIDSVIQDKSGNQLILAVHTMAEDANINGTQG